MNKWIEVQGYDQGPNWIENNIGEMLPETLYVYRESLEPFLHKLKKEDVFELFKYALGTKGASDTITTSLVFKFIDA